MCIIITPILYWPGPDLYSFIMLIVGWHAQENMATLSPSLFMHIYMGDPSSDKVGLSSRNGEVVCSSSLCSAMATVRQNRFLTPPCWRHFFLLHFCAQNLEDFSSYSSELHFLFQYFFCLEVRGQFLQLFYLSMSLQFIVEDLWAVEEFILFASTWKTVG
jgi:hypothetical protein